LFSEGYFLNLGEKVREKGDEEMTLRKNSFIKIKKAVLNFCGGL